MSVSQGRACAVVDAGMKAVSFDSGPPHLLEPANVAAGLLPGAAAANTSSAKPSGDSSGSGSGSGALSFEGVEFQNGGDEHGKLLWPLAAWQSPPRLPHIGQKLLLQPGHCDPTVNLYDTIVAWRRAQGVVGVWPIAARGPGS
jgi:D-serine deaminase-like pyridoxal phosphate-dependent protein